jgi:sugar fermentation stimulation protein A
VTYKGYELPKLLPGKLVKRYKRFLADIELETVELETSKIVTAHCANSGSMRGCATPGDPVWISRSDNPRRKLNYTWELIQTKDSMIGVNTMIPNRLVKASIESGLVSELKEYTKVTAEVKTSDHNRLDLLLENETGRACYLEIKNCTLVEKGVAMFPDAITTRGQKHLDELVRLKRQGHRAVIFYLIQRMDARIFTPAAMIDRVYAQKLKHAVESGVEIMTRDTFIDTKVIRLRQSIPVRL